MPYWHREGHVQWAAGTAAPRSVRVGKYEECSYLGRAASVSRAVGVLVGRIRSAALRALACARVPRFVGKGGTRQEGGNADRAFVSSAQKKAAALYTQAGDYQKTARFYYKKAEDTYYQANNWASYDDWRRARDQWDYFYSRNRCTFCAAASALLP